MEESSREEKPVLLETVSASSGPSWSLENLMKDTTTSDWTVRVKDHPNRAAREIHCDCAIQAEMLALNYAHGHKRAYLCFRGQVWMKAGHTSVQTRRGNVKTMAVSAGASA